jgi:hypothetical protein
MQTRSLRVGVGMLVLVAAACSGSGSSSSNGAAAASPATVDRYCTSYCTYQAGCYGGQPRTPVEDSTCAPTCKAQYQSGRTRDSFLQGVATCLDSVDCSGKYDCTVRYALADSAFPNVSTVQKCLTLAAKIPQNNSPDACIKGNVEGQCNYLATLTDPARANADAACLGGSKDCDALSACLSNASE